MGSKQIFRFILITIAGAIIFIIKCNGWQYLEFLFNGQLFDYFKLIPSVVQLYFFYHFYATFAALGLPGQLRLYQSPHWKDSI